MHIGNFGDDDDHHDEDDDDDDEDDDHDDHDDEFYFSMEEVFRLCDLEPQHCEEVFMALEHSVAERSE